MTRELHCYEYVNHSYAEVKRVLLVDPIALFQRATAAAVNRATSVAAHLSANVGALEVGTGITIELAGVEEGKTHSVLGVPVTHLKLKWVAAQAAALFPSMTAELSVFPLSGTETQVVLDGQYQPPLGAVGVAVDAILMHRVAEASVHRFVRQLSERIRLEIEEAGPT